MRGQLAAALALLLASQLLAGQSFDPGCPLPFDVIKEEGLSIDEGCDVEGKATLEAHQVQNRAKNAFCAPGPARRVTLATMQRLQKRVDALGIPYGSSNNLPEDRTVLQDLHTTTDGHVIGEGSRVVIVAFVVDAHHSNVKKGESVNCKRPRRENNDIHISLGGGTGVSGCDTITAEISPHYRPTAWDPEYLQGLKHPVRVTGHLFFDASHKPCTPTKKASPERASSWEVHPVYAIDVCKHTTIQGCSPFTSAHWTPLHEAAEAHWTNEEDE